MPMLVVLTQNKTKDHTAIILYTSSTHMNQVFVNDLQDISLF